jgi:rhodanese-related sulfurtransferase
MRAAELHELIAKGRAPLIVDVRSPSEFAEGHVPGAINVPVTALIGSAPPPAVQQAPEVVLYCGHGPRAYVAARALRLRGVQRIDYLRGHMAGWRRERLPEERE